MDQIINSLMANIGSPEVAQKVGAQTQIDPSKVTDVLKLALPAIAGGIQKNVQNPSGAQSLIKALASHDGGILKNIDGLAQNPAIGNGVGILKHVFGENLGKVESGIAKKTNLNTPDIAQIMTIAAPLVMGALGQKLKSFNSQDAMAFAKELLKGKNTLSMATALLDKNKDGKILDDVIRLVQRFLKKK